MNSSRKLHEMMTSSKQAKKPWVSHHQRRRRFWALIMWLCSAGVQTIRMVPIRSILLRWTVWQTSTSRKRGNRTRSFMNLFVSSFAYFIEDYFFPSISVRVLHRQPWPCWLYHWQGWPRCSRAVFFGYPKWGGLPVYNQGFAFIRYRIFYQWRSWLTIPHVFAELRYGCWWVSS